MTQSSQEVITNSTPVMLKAGAATCELLLEALPPDTMKTVTDHNDIVKEAVNQITKDKNQNFNPNPWFTFKQTCKVIWDLSVTKPFKHSVDKAEHEKSAIEYLVAGLTATYSVFFKAIPGYLQFMIRVMNTPLDWLNDRLKKFGGERKGFPGWKWLSAKLLQSIIFLPKQFLERLANLMGYLSNLLTGVFQSALGLGKLILGIPEAVIIRHFIYPESSEIHQPIKLTIDETQTHTSTPNEIAPLSQVIKSACVNVWAGLKNIARNSLRLAPEAAITTAYFLIPPVAAGVETIMATFNVEEIVAGDLVLANAARMFLPQLFVSPISQQIAKLIQPFQPTQQPSYLSQTDLTFSKTGQNQYEITKETTRNSSPKSVIVSSPAFFKDIKDIPESEGQGFIKLPTQNLNPYQNTSQLTQ